MDKKLQEETEAKKKDFMDRRTAFISEIEPLTVKYKIALMPVLEYRREGVIPAIIFVDDPEAGKTAPEDKIQLETA